MTLKSLFVLVDGFLLLFFDFFFWFESLLRGLFCSMERQSRLSATVHTPSRWNPLHEPLPVERGDRSMYRRTMEEVSG